MFINKLAAQNLAIQSPPQKSNRQTNKYLIFDATLEVAGHWSFHPSHLFF